MEHHELSHSDPDQTHANFVSIMFEYHKHDEQNNMITQHHMGDPLLYPTHQWGTIIHHICTYPGSCDNMPVNMILSHKQSKLQQITNNMILSKHCATTNAIRKDELGFHANDLGLHSIPNGAAMSMYLMGVPVFVIMLIGQ